MFDVYIQEVQLLAAHRDPSPKQVVSQGLDLPVQVGVIKRVDARVWWLKRSWKMHGSVRRVSLNMATSTSVSVMISYRPCFFLRAFMPRTFQTPMVTVFHFLLVETVTWRPTWF